MNASPRLAVIIPVHGQIPTLEQCLQSVRSTPSNVQFEVVLVDDGTPGGLGNVPSQYSVETVIERPVQGGFTAAVNEALTVLSEQFDSYVLLNSDMQVLPNWIDALVARWNESEAIGIVGGLELSVDDPDEIVNAGSRPVIVDGELTNILQLSRTGRVSEGSYQVGEQLSWVSFGVALISGFCFRSLGPLDADLVNYFSDADYCQRANLAGFQVWYEPLCRVLHRQHVTTRLYRAAGILKFQEDRERYCEKWLPPSLIGNQDERRSIYRLADANSVSQTRLVPHLDPSTPLSPQIRARLLRDPGIRTDVEEVLHPRGDAAGIKRLRALRRLHFRGLAYVDLDCRRDAMLSGPLDDYSIEVLAPHPDDAAISLGGLLVSRKRARSHTKVHVLFGRSNYALGAFAGIGGESITTLRAFEEAAYCGQVNAEYKIASLPDRLLRRPQEPVLLQHPGDIEDDIVGAIVDRISHVFDLYYDSFLLVPLAAGLMADHAAVAASAATVIRLGFPTNRVLVYDDLPYAAEPGAVSLGVNLYRRLGLELEPVVLDVSPWFEEKCELLALHVSQQPGRFLTTIEQYGQGLVAGIITEAGTERWRRAERLWTIRFATEDRSCDRMRDPRAE